MRGRKRERRRGRRRGRKRGREREGEKEKEKKRGREREGRRRGREKEGEVKYNGKLTVLDFILVGQELRCILGLKSCLELCLIKRIYSLEKERPVEAEYSHVFKGVGVIRGVEHQIKMHTQPKKPLLFKHISERAQLFCICSCVIVIIDYAPIGKIFFILKL